jgi:hypothetical protein
MVEIQELSFDTTTLFLHFLAIFSQVQGRISLYTSQFKMNAIMLHISCVGNLRQT